MVRNRLTRRWVIRCHRDLATTFLVSERLSLEDEDAEEVVAAPELLDLAMVMGTGYPPEQGGPLRYADARGISAVLTALRALAAQHGERFVPAPLLERMAERSLTFYSSDPAALRAAVTPSHP